MRNAGLDILRFVAVMLVIGHHLSIEQANKLSAFGYYWQRGGWVGVDLFFVLSGFLVSGLLFSEVKKHATLSAGRFLIRRGFKIYPAFWVLITVTVVVLAAKGVPIEGRRLAGELLFLQNYLAFYWGPNWSLAVEEHFYLLLALSFSLAYRRWGARAFRYIPHVVALIAVSCFALRARLGVIPASNWIEAARTHLRLDGLAFGVLLSYLWHYEGLSDKLRRIPSAALTLGGCALLAVAFLAPDGAAWMPSWGLTACYLGAGLVLLAAVRYERAGNKLTAGAAFIGSFSYSIYLWHFPVLTWGMSAVGKRLPVLADELFIPTYILGSLALGLLSGYLIEQPALRVRDRLFPSRGKIQKATLVPAD
jgi:peptidoglycan/LPS O-acetylase OafA/YrhL